MVLPYGYDTAELAVGDALLTCADNAMAAARVKDAAQKAATKTAQAAAEFVKAADAMLQ